MGQGKSALLKQDSLLPLGCDCKLSSPPGVAIGNCPRLRGFEVTNCLVVQLQDNSVILLTAFKMHPPEARTISDRNYKTICENYKTILSSCAMQTIHARKPPPHSHHSVAGHDPLEGPRQHPLHRRCELRFLLRGHHEAAVERQVHLVHTLLPQPGPGGHLGGGVDAERE
eukprot:1025140-Prorocentrum_minimum.AAC.1